MTIKENALVFAGVNFKDRTTIYEDIRRSLLLHCCFASTVNIQGHVGTVS